MGAAIRNYLGKAVLARIDIVAVFLSLETVTGRGCGTANPSNPG
jgi:hypothetical protein